ncbi:MAG: PKD domain-containing protein [Ignavibacteria bacterium]|nr:PKD domain-containing protein [Ignavibacteria bacterium]
MASISDKKTGALLFYTDGITVWNSQHEVMTGGTSLKGGSSSTQSALIIPNPANIQQYYLFTVPEYESGESTLYYSIVNMATPKGEVIAKNTPLYTNVSEKLTGTLDCDGSGFWIVAHHVSNSEFYSFHITSTGVSSAPIVSRHTADNSDYRAGYMKISPDRTKIALASQIPTGYLALATFSPLTGMISGYLTISDGGNTCPLFTYGLAFSPDNSKLYATGLLSSIFQYEINLPTETAIRNSQSILNITGGGLQLAPDGKIYIAQENTRYLGRIDLPNLKGDACMYKQDVIALPRLALLGLPNCLDYIFNQVGQPGISRCSTPIAMIKSDSGCYGYPLVFTELSTNATKRTWTFTGGTPSTSTAMSESVTYPAPGKYPIRLVVENAMGSDTAYSEATIFPNPVATAGFDKTICSGATAHIGAPPTIGETYSWFPATALDDPTKSSPMATPSNTTQYILTVVSEHGCYAHDTVNVTVGSIIAKVSNDTSICEGKHAQLTASGGTNYEWSPAEGLSDSTIENPIAIPLKTTIYKVRVSSGTCQDSATVTITVNPQPTANAGQDQSICAGNSTPIGEAPKAGNMYLWQPSAGLSSETIANPTASPTISTQYVLTVTGAGGCIATDTVIVTVGNLKASVSADTTICSRANVQLFASGGANYEWFPKSGLSDAFIPNPIASPNISTTYKVVITMGVCVDSAFTTITIDSLSFAKAGGDLNICEGDEALIGAQSVPGNLYQWSPLTGVKDPNSAQTIVTPQATTMYTVQVTTPTGCTTTDEVSVSVFPKISHAFTLTPDMVVILPGAPFRTVLHVPTGVSTWEIRLKYGSLLAEFQGVNTLSSTLQLNLIKEHNGELTLHGTGENGEVELNFKAFLPHNSDTVFAMNLIIDTAQTAQCDRATGQGTKLLLDAYCGKYFRMVSSTGKQYFLTVKEKSIDFGVGLSGKVSLEVFDYVGNSVLVVSDGALEAGEYSAELDLPVGVYYCRMRAGMYEYVGKVFVRF